MQSFGKPQFLMPFNLKGSKPLVHADKNEVMEKITQQGFYLQMPKQDDGLFNSLSGFPLPANDSLKTSSRIHEKHLSVPFPESCRLS